MASYDFSSSFTSMADTSTSFSVLNSSEEFRDQYYIDNVIPESIQFINGNSNSDDHDHIVLCKDLGVDPLIIGHIVNNPKSHADLLAQIFEMHSTILPREECNPSVVSLRTNEVLANEKFQAWRKNMEVTLQQYKLSDDMKFLRKTVKHQDAYGLIQIKIAKYLHANQMVHLSAFSDPELKEVVVLGLVDEVDKVERELLGDILNQENVNCEIDLTDEEISLLRKLKFERVLKKPQFTMVEIQKTSVRFQGLQEDVKTTIAEMRKQLATSKCLKLELNDMQKEILDEQRVQTHILKKLTMKGSKVQMHISKDDQNEFYIAGEYNKVAGAKNFVEDYLVSIKFAIEDQNIVLMLPGKWETEEKQLVLNFKRKPFRIKFSLDDREIRLVGLKEEYLRNMRERIQYWIESCTSKETVLKLSKIETIYLRETKLEDLESLRKESMHHIVKESPNEDGYNVTATPTGIQNFESTIKSWLKRSKSSRIGIIDEGMSTYLLTEEGKTKLQELGHRHQLAVIVHEGSARLRFINGTIENQTADVLVNSVSPDLDLMVGQPKVATSFLDKGGNELQRLLNSQQERGITFGEMVVTKATRGIKCREIFHCCLGHFQSKDESEPKLQEIIDKCLRQANQKNFKSIAFPAVGTGNLAFPPKIAVQVMMDVAGKFICENPNSCLQSITIVRFPENQKVIQAFDSEYQRRKFSERESESIIKHYFTTDHWYICEYQLEVLSDSDDITAFLNDVSQLLT